MQEYREKLKLAQGATFTTDQAARIVMSISNALPKAERSLDEIEQFLDKQNL